MTILKLFSYWQMLQCFGNKSWTKTGAFNAADTILNNWISLAVYTLASAPWREAAQKPSRSWLVPIQQRWNDPCFFLPVKFSRFLKTVISQWGEARVSLNSDLMTLYNNLELKVFGALIILCHWHWGFIQTIWENVKLCQLNHAFKIGTHCI